MKTANDIMQELNNPSFNYLDFLKISIPDEIENKKELEYILKLRLKSNDGYLVGPTDLETAKRALILESEGVPISFDIDGGYPEVIFFTYAHARDIVTFEKTHEYYEQVRKFLKDIGSSEEELDDMLLKSKEVDVYDLGRDLKSFIFSEKTKNAIKEFLKK